MVLNAEGSIQTSLSVTPFKKDTNYMGSIDRLLWFIKALILIIEYHLIHPAMCAERERESSKISFLVLRVYKIVRADYMDQNQIYLKIKGKRTIH